MNPKHLRSFLAVARSGNVTAAAREVNLAQSSVSDQLQTLEGELGTQLFTRSIRGLTLTASGKALKPYAEEMLALTEEARKAVAEAGETAQGALVIGALETIAAARLPQWMAELQRQNPEIRPRLQVAGSGALVQGVADGSIDAAFCFDRGKVDDRLGRRIVCLEPLVLVASPDADLPAAPALAELSGHRFVATEPGCVYRQLLEHAFSADRAAVPQIAAEVGSINAIGRLVAGGTGLALIPRIAVAEMLDAGALKAIAWPGSTDRAKLIMIWRRRRVQPAALRSLIAVVEGMDAAFRSDDARHRHEAQCRS